MTTIPVRIPVTVGKTTPPHTDVALAAALTRFLATKAAPDYLRAAGTTWLNARPVK